MITKRNDGRPLRVHVCVDQELGAKAGGLARTWMRLLEEVAAHDDLDLTIHAPAPVARVQTPAPNARVCEHAVSFRLARALERRGVRSAVPLTLVPWVRGLGRELAAADVVQTTSTHLAFSMAGLLAAKRLGIPLVNALQTDLVSYAEIDAAALAERLRRRSLGRLLVPDAARFARTVRAGLERQVEWYLRQCELVFVSAPTQTRHVALAGPAARAAYLPRGIDTTGFSPAHRDREWLAQRYGIPRDEPVILFVGRIAAEKSPLVLADAVRRLHERGTRCTLLICGNGPERAAVTERLQGCVVFAGFQPHDVLRRIYASSDVFAFPSATECFANVVVEAMASGLPVLVSDGGGARQHVARSGSDGVIVSDQSGEVWAAAIGDLARDQARRAAIGRRARERVVARYPSWKAVMAEVVRPGWLSAAAASVRFRPRARGGFAAVLRWASAREVNSRASTAVL